MITRDEAHWLVEFDAIVADLDTDGTWLQNAALYAVTPSNPAVRGRSDVIFVNKASGHVQHTPYAAVSTLLETMRPVG